ncbi:DUF397 domain-containing protein [Streptomyces sp. NPDC059255]|uniref:DUF397 domain-containing protein n=1 Tax=Streptomyces sp. NPDC059255 TaxID=3346793 RepID=UPI0036AB6E6D
MIQPRTYDTPGLTTVVWRKSSYSDGAGNNCVEVAELALAVGIRDSKDITRSALIVPVDAWTSFVGLIASH